jgi:hypothetical protein
MTKKKLGRKEEAEKRQSKSEEIGQKKLSKKEEFVQKILRKKDDVTQKIPSKKEEKVAEPHVAREKEIIEESFGRREEVAEKSMVKKKEPEKVAEPKVTVEAAQKEPSEEVVKQAGVMSDEIRGKCSEINKLLGDLTRSMERNWKELRRIKDKTYSADTMVSEKVERELYGKLENSRNEARAELDELHKILQKYEKRVIYKDEAEGELQSLEEVKMLLWDKLRNISRRIERFKVRPRSDLAKLFAEAKECEDEVKKSEEDILDFEREYTKFLSMMGKISG